MTKNLGNVYALRPDPQIAESYYERGLWRDSTLLNDLETWRVSTPDAVALVAQRTGGEVRQVTYAEYASWVERFAGGLLALGVGAGQTVAIQLPNWWQVNPLILACLRVGAIVEPIMMSLGPRELERVLARMEASVCVTPDQFGGIDYPGQVADMAPRLPSLRHRVVIADKSAGETSDQGLADVVDFAEHFERTAWEQKYSVALAEARDDPDRASVVLFTSGTSGEPKGVLHSQNTLYATVHPRMPWSSGTPVWWSRRRTAACMPSACTSAW